MDRRMVGEEGGVTMTEKKKFQVPHSMAIIVAAMILAYFNVSDSRWKF